MPRVALALIALAIAAAPASAQTTVKGVDGPGPPRYDKVRVVKSGPASAKRVLVIVPGTSASAGNTAQVGADIAQRLKGWQVWSVSRRETLLEDHATFERALKGEVSPAQVFDYYLGWLANSQVTDHVKIPADADVAYARRWGMATAIGDLHRVVEKARAGGKRKVVLAGHSLGGTIAVAYATWDFGGRAGARDLEGLVLIDGGSGRTPLKTRAAARKAVKELETGSPFLDLTGNGVPWSLGVFAELGATLSRIEPTAPARLTAFPLLPASLRAPVPVTNRGGFGYGVDSETSPPELALAHVHAGHLAESGDPHDWVDAELTPIARAESLFIDGTVVVPPAPPVARRLGGQRRREDAGPERARAARLAREAVAHPRVRVRDEPGRRPRHQGRAEAREAGALREVRRPQRHLLPPRPARGRPGAQRLPEDRPAVPAPRRPLIPQGPLSGLGGWGPKLGP